MPYECEKREADWIALIEADDVEALWMELYRLVSRHAVVSERHRLMGLTSHEQMYGCLTQGLFLELLARQRFDHYLNNAYSNADIESDIARLHLAALIDDYLSRRRPDAPAGEMKTDPIKEEDYD